MGLTGLKPRYCRMVFPLEAPGEKVPHHAVSRVCTHSSAGVPLPETASLTSESIFRSALTFLLLLLLGLLRPTWKNQANLPNSRFLIQLHLHSLLFQINEHIPRFWRLVHECHGGGVLMTPATAGSPFFLAVSSLEATHMYWIMASCGQQHQDWSFLCWRLSGPSSTPFTYLLITLGPLRVTQDNPTTLKSDG